MNKFVLSQHANQDKPLKIDDLPDQVFLPGQEPEPEPVQVELFKSDPEKYDRMIQQALDRMHDLALKTIA